MTIDSIANVLLALAVIGLLIWRQLRWRNFDAARALRLPLILAAIGVLNLSQLHGTVVTALDATLFVLELLLSVGVGAAMGRLSVFRPAPADAGMVQVRTGWVGASLWAVLIAVRIGFDFIGAALGAQLLTQTGVILLLLAASRATTALVVRAREPHRALRSA